MIEYICPQCSSSLEIKDGNFFCVEHGNFRVDNNINLFLKQKYNYFEKHWDNFDEKSYPVSKVNAAESFLGYIDKNCFNLNILDAGCGDGVQIKHLSNSISDSNNIYGIDISLTALRKCKQTTPDAHVSYADVQNLPFKDNYFDIVFSYGVLAYVPDIEKAIKEILRVSKKNGKIGVWFYPKPPFLKLFILKLVRFLATCCNGVFASILANIIVPFLYILPTNSKINLSNASWIECKEVAMVNIAPQNIWFPTENEIIQLFKKYNIQINFISKTDKIMIWGEKNEDN